MAQTKRVMIVDDEPHILRSLGFVLRKAGFEVVEARSGQQALELIGRQRPDLVFLDIMMPELDGYEVCRQIKASRELSSIYVILLTAKGQESDRQKGLEAGAEEYMTKPFSPARAVARVEAVLSGRS